MGKRWVDALLVVVAALSTVGFVRSVWQVSPAAADLPEPLRSEELKLEGYSSLRRTITPAQIGRDRAWGPTHRYHLVSPQGKPVLVELVVLRSRNWEGMVLPNLASATTITIKSNQELRRGQMGAIEVMQTCLVGGGRKGDGVVALVDGKALQQAAVRWRERLDRPATREEGWLRRAAVVGGLRVSERWECLLVTLKTEGGAQRNRDNDLLLDAWKRIYPQLAIWGRTWEGVNY